MGVGVTEDSALLIGLDAWLTASDRRPKTEVDAMRGLVLRTLEEHRALLAGFVPRNLLN